MKTDKMTLMEILNQYQSDPNTRTTAPHLVTLFDTVFEVSCEIDRNDAWVCVQPQDDDHNYGTYYDVADLEDFGASRACDSIIDDLQGD